MLQENEKQLSGGFRQSLRLLINKPKRAKRRGVDNSPQNTSLDVAEHKIAVSPAVWHEDQPITSSYARQIQKEQDTRQAQSLAAQSEKLARQREWEEELDKARVLN